MPSSDPTARLSSPSDWRLLNFVLGSLFLANVVQWAICHALHLGNPGGLKGLVSSFWHFRQWTDSWLPMMKSLDYFQAHPNLPIYYAPLYDTLIYSLASELPLVFLRKLGISDPAMLRFFAITTWFAVIGVAVASLAMGKRLLAARGLKLPWQSIFAVFLAVLGCYPILKGYSLGNAQTYLSFLFAVLLYLWSTGRERSAGVTAALLAFVKPQYVLLLIWMALRKRWSAMWAFLATSAVLLLFSVIVFGMHNNLDYIPVLASLSHKAQTHFGNQSMFGTINRMIFNGENITYTPLVYTPYIPWVYRTTVITSLIIVGSVLFFPWGKLRGSSADIAAMAIASVAASPMAWEHHYGITFVVFAWAWFAYGATQRRKAWLLGLSFFLCNNFLSSLNLLADKGGWNILQSYIYFGALLLVVLLMRLARTVTRGEEPELI